MIIDYSNLNIDIKEIKIAEPFLYDEHVYMLVHPPDDFSLNDDERMGVKLETGEPWFFVIGQDFVSRINSTLILNRKMLY